jgi:hypothetical protein
MKVHYAHVDSLKVTQRLVRNENYGGPAVSLHGWKMTPVTPARYKKGFFEQMRESVRQEGFRNPIILWNLPEGLLLGFGCSRLRVAQEEKMLIPALVIDYTGRFALDREVTEDNWQEFFTDIPDYFEFDGDGVEYHYSLERNRRHSFDPKGMAWARADYIDDSFIEKEFYWTLETYDGT